MDLTRLIVAGLAAEGLAILTVLVWIALRLESGVRRKRNPSREIKRDPASGIPQNPVRHRADTWRKSPTDYPN